MIEAASAAAMWVAAGVLAWAGLSKIVRPDGTRTALRAAGLPAGPTAARGLGAAEIGVGLAALAFGGPVAAPLAVSYVALAAFSDRQRRRPAATCGCFGDADAPLTRAHVAINAVAAVASGTAAAVGAPGVAAATDGQPGVLIVALIATASATSVVMQFLTSVPTLAARMSTSRGADA